MKKIISIISIVLIAMVMVFSCSKENATDKPRTKNELTAYEVHINKTLKDFKQKMEFIRANPLLKSGESVPTDSAVWLLEATINFSHAFPNEYYSEFETDSLTLTVNRNEDGTVDMNELTGKYDEMKVAVSEAYHNSGYEVKGLAVVDLEVNGVTEDEITISIQTCVGEKSTPPPDPGIDGPFVEGDDWWYGENKGHCDWDWEFDAAEKLNDAMNTYLAEQNAGLFFIRETERTRKGGDYNVRRIGDPNPPDNNIDYYLYSASEVIGPVNDEMKCLEWTEMNVYFNLMRYLIYTKIPNDDLPPGYLPMQLTYQNGDSEIVNENYYHFFHQFTYKFGIPIGYDEGEGPEEI